MGTNYYTKINECFNCGRHDNIHLGKSSFGWKFTFNLNGKKYYRNYKELLDFIMFKKIKDEYGRVVDHKEFIELIEAKQNSKSDDENTIDIDGYSFIDCEFS